jgi:putative ABC transport system permease protein
MVQEQLIDRVSRLPDVASVSLAVSVPLSASGSIGLVQRPGEKPIRTNLNYVSPDYFETLGIPLRRGRVFATASSPEDVVVSESLARLVAGGDEPIGRRFMTNQGAQHIIGIIRDIKARDLNTNEVFFLYRRYGIRGGPYRGDLARLPAGGTIHIRARHDPSALVPTVSAILRSIDATVPLGEARLFRDHVDRWMARSRSLAGAVGVFSVLALLLSAIGLYGLISQTVAAQMREIGIRMTLGAAPSDVRRRVLARSAQLVGLGLTVGIVLVVSAAEPVMGSLVFGLNPTDTSTIAGAAATLLAVSCLASYMPARRASRVDPATVLRME